MIQTDSPVQRGVSKSAELASGHNQLLAGSDTATLRFFMDFDVDQPMLGKDRKKADHFKGFNKIRLKYGCHAESCDIS
jgi:hypothetical protein